MLSALRLLAVITDHCQLVDASAERKVYTYDLSARREADVEPHRLYYPCLLEFAQEYYFRESAL